MKTKEVKKVSVSNRKVSKVNYAFEGDENDEKSTSTSTSNEVKTDFRNNKTLLSVAEVY